MSNMYVSCLFAVFFLFFSCTEQSEVKEVAQQEKSLVQAIVDTLLDVSSSGEVMVDVLFAAEAVGEGSMINLVKTNGNDTQILGSANVTEGKAVFLIQEEKLQLLYLQPTDSSGILEDHHIIPLLVDTVHVTISVDENWRVTYNSKESEDFYFITEYIRFNIDQINHSLDGLLAVLDSLSPGYAPFTILASLKVTPLNYDQVNQIASKYTEKEHPYAQKLKNFLPRLSPNYLASGTVAPDFELLSPDGSHVRLSSFRGKYVLLDFWATWCGPCMAEMSNVVKVYDEYKGQKFEIIGISLDNDKKVWKQTINKMGLIWKHGLDIRGENAVASLYMVNGIPYTYLIDPEGFIIAKNLRGSALVSKLTPLFKD